MSQAPQVICDRTADGVRFSLAGQWTIDSGALLETNVAALLAGAVGAARAIIDLGGIDRLDTSGAWLIDRTRQDLDRKGVDTQVENLRPEYEILLSEAHYRTFPSPPAQEAFLRPRNSRRHGREHRQCRP